MIVGISSIGLEVSRISVRKIVAQIDSAKVVLLNLGGKLKINWLSSLNESKSNF
jgi:hypothetical protein